MSGNKTKVAVLRLAGCGTARRLVEAEARAEVVIFAEAFADEDDAAPKLADFEIVLSMRERTPLPGSLIDRLPKLRMLGMTGARNASLDTRPAPRAASSCAARPRRRQHQRFRDRGIGARTDDRGGARPDVGRRKYRAGKFQMGVPVGIGLAGKTLGMVGLGRLGGYMARYGRGDAHERDRLEPEPDRRTVQGNRRGNAYSNGT